jgi:hypothetical protein
MAPPAGQRRLCGRHCRRNAGRRRHERGAVCETKPMGSLEAAGTRAGCRSRGAIVRNKAKCGQDRISGQEPSPRAMGWDAEWNAQNKANLREGRGCRNHRTERRLWEKVGLGRAWKTKQIPARRGMVGIIHPTRAIVRNKASSGRGPAEQPKRAGTLAPLLCETKQTWAEWDVWARTVSACNGLGRRVERAKQSQLGRAGWVSGFRRTCAARGRS